MSLHRFYCPSLTVGVNDLPEDEAHHAGAVIRLRPGDAVELFNGRGTVAPGVIEQVSRPGVTVQVEKTKKVPFELRHRLTLAAAMSKAHRQGYMVEKCTELGAAAIWPILAARSVTQPGEAAVEKWSRRAIEAAKQSGRVWVPPIASVAAFSDALSRAGEFHLALFCDFAADATPILQVLQSKLPSKVVHQDAPYTPEKSQLTAPGSIRLEPGPPRQSTIDNSLIAFVGPEGGWTDDERRAAREAGLTAVLLSPTVLRAETAAVAICAVLAAQSAGAQKNPNVTIPLNNSPSSQWVCLAK